MQTVNKNVMVLVHPGSACGSADFNLGDEAAPLRDALASEIMKWKGDVFILDGELSDELDHYATLGLAVQACKDTSDQHVVREMACALTMENWVDVAMKRFEAEWPGGPHRILLTGAWTEPDKSGCVDAMAEALGGHDITISQNALSCS